MNAARMLITFLMVAMSLALAHCSSSQSVAAAELPAWLRAKIANYEKSPRGSSPDAIWRYTVDGKDAYYFCAPCCDQFNPLFDANGKYLCAPDGGFSGKGDMKCTPAQTKPSVMELVWQDPRLGLTISPDDKTK